MRDDFPKPVVETLAKRVGNRCSNPGCRKRTSGPHTEDDKALNVGVAAHITAASPGGPRYNPSLTPDERKEIGNGIWLCQSCGKLVDNDELRYTKAMLVQWKQDAEQEALRDIESPSDRSQMNKIMQTQATPSIDILSAQFQPAQFRALQGTGWIFSTNIYVIPRGNAPLVIPLHRCKGYAEFVGMGERVKFERLEFANGTLQQLVCKEPTNLVIRAFNNGFPSPAQADDKVNVTLWLNPVDAAEPIVLSLTLFPDVTQIVWRL